MHFLFITSTWSETITILTKTVFTYWFYFFTVTCWIIVSVIVGILSFLIPGSRFIYILSKYTSSTL